MTTKQKMKRFFIYSIALLIWAGKSPAQSVLNGSFEYHNAIACDEMLYDEYNAASSASTAYGLGGHYTFVNASCTTLFGGEDIGYSLPIHGSWTLSIYNWDTLSIVDSYLTMQLSAPLNPGNWYRLTFYSKAPLGPPPPWIYAEGSRIKLGISNTATTFGDFIYEAPRADSNWTQQSVVFQAPNNGQYLSIETIEESGRYGIQLDHFVLSTDTTSAIAELNGRTPKLLRIVDILGKETTAKANTPLFYLYDDGTVEKKMIYRDE
jgi:hypothetical protein